MVRYYVFETARKIKRKVPILSKIRLRKRVLDPRLALYGGNPVSEYRLPTNPYLYTQRDAERIFEIVLSGKLTHDSGHEIKLLEKEFTEFTGTKYALATNSCTSALTLACKALGIKPGDEVVIPAYTFVACAQAVLACGGIPRFADIDETFNISPDSVKEKITPQTKILMIVHMFGNIANLPKLLAIAQKHNLFVIEDCAQAIGASFKGRKVGSFGDIGCFSFNEKKALPTGQGGILTTSNKIFYEIAKFTRNTGVSWGRTIDVKTTGGTYYMTEMEAALARNILAQLELLNERRRKNFEVIKKNFAQVSDFCQTYEVIKDSRSSFSRLAFMINFEKLKMNRNFFLRAINEEGVPMKTFYPKPLYRYSLLKNKKDVLTNNNFPFSLNKEVSYRVSLPYVEKFCKNQVAMEFSPYLIKEDVLSILKAMKKVAYYNKTKSFHFSFKQDSEKSRKKLKLGMIGLGGISEVHAKAFTKNPHVTIEAICDLNEKVLKEKSKNLRIEKAYANYKKILDDQSVNVVDILLPHHLHYKVILDSLSAEKTVICEKPLVTKTSEVRNIMKASQKTGKRVYVKHYLRHATLHNDVKNIILGEGLGKVYLVNCLFTVNSIESFMDPKSWKTNVKEGGGGVLMDNGIHIIDLLIYLLGNPISVFSICQKTINKHASKGEDVSVTTLEFKNNRVANIVCTATDTSAGFKWEKRFFATNGQLLLEDFGKEKMVLTVIKNKKITFQKIDENWWEKANLNALADIIQRIEENKPPSINFTQIEKGLEAVLKAYKSCVTGRKYTLKP